MKNTGKTMTIKLPPVAHRSALTVLALRRRAVQMHDRRVRRPGNPRRRDAQIGGG